jgi:hypothetical protein
MSIPKGLQKIAAGCEQRATRGYQFEKETPSPPLEDRAGERRPSGIAALDANKLCWQACLSVMLMIQLSLAAAWFSFAIVCGWIGHIVVKAFTFGKVDLDWGYSSTGSVLTEWLGLVFVLGTEGMIAWLVPR